MKILLMVMALLMALTPNVRAEVYQQGVVYVIYNLEGEGAVKKDDVNKNGVPDMVEDVATQINATREVFRDVYKFPDPFESQRFKNVHTIEVDIVDKKKLKVNGVAFSNVRGKSKHNPSERALYVNIANTVNPRKNATPAHEYFHLVQYGATYFRNGWFLEGMARWSQDVVENHKKYPDGRDLSWRLKNKLTETQIYQGKYNVASVLWYPLAVGMKDKAKIPSKLVKKYRYADGSEVFHDNVIYGPNVMREVMKEMKSKESEAAAEFGGEKQWRSKGQRSEKNNKIVLDCVRTVFERGVR